MTASTTPVRAGEDAGREATDLLKERIACLIRERDAAAAGSREMNRLRALAEAEVARLTQERDAAAAGSREMNRLRAQSGAEASALRERVARLEEENANLHIAFTVLSESGHGGGMYEVRRWFNSGTEKPIPWPGGALFEAWATEMGIVNRDGAMAFRAALTEGAPTDV